MNCTCGGCKGAFLHGVFPDGKEIHIQVPEVWKKFYPANAVLKLLSTIYGLKQAAMAFWKQLLQWMLSMNMKRSEADLCLHYAWTVWDGHFVDWLQPHHWEQGQSTQYQEQADGTIWVQWVQWDEQVHWQQDYKADQYGSKIHERCDHVDLLCQIWSTKQAYEYSSYPREHSRK